jgi:uncharacterized membrane protein
MAITVKHGKLHRVVPVLKDGYHPQCRDAPGNRIFRFSDADRVMLANPCVAFLCDLCGVSRWTEKEKHEERIGPGRLLLIFAFFHNGNSFMAQIAAFLHVLSVVVWVGGMFFAHQCLRPVAASQLEPPVRLTLWVGVFGRFFPWVWAAVATLLITGLFMIVAVYGGFKHASPYIHVMFGLGLVMMGIFMHVFFSPYRRLKAAVAAGDWPSGGKSLTQIRHLVGLNTLIGISVIAVATIKAL